MNEYLNTNVTSPLSSTNAGQMARASIDPSAGKQKGSRLAVDMPSTMPALVGSNGGHQYGRKP